MLRQAILRQHNLKKSITFLFFMRAFPAQSQFCTEHFLYLSNRCILQNNIQKTAYFQ